MTTYTRCHVESPAVPSIIQGSRAIACCLPCCSLSFATASLRHSWQEREVEEGFVHADWNRPPCARHTAEHLRDRALHAQHLVRQHIRQDCSWCRCDLLRGPCDKDVWALHRWHSLPKALAGGTAALRRCSKVHALLAAWALLKGACSDTGVCG